MRQNPSKIMGRGAKPHNPPPSRSAGLSLISVIIALMLANIIVIFGMQAYVLIQKSLTKFHVKFNLLQQADLISLYLRRDIRAAGYRGDNSMGVLLAIDQRQDNSQFNNTNAAISLQPVTLAQLHKFPKKLRTKFKQQKLKRNSTIILLKNVPELVGVLEHDLQDPCASLRTSLAAQFKPKDYAALADLHQIESFSISAVIAARWLEHKLPANRQACFTKAYQAGTTLLKLRDFGYYLAKPKATDLTYTLYRDDFNNAAEVISRGILAWDVQWFTAQDLLVQLQAKTTPALAALLGLKIQILLQSDQTVCGAQQIWWRGKLQQFNDGRCRMVLNLQAIANNT